MAIHHVTAGRFAELTEKPGILVLCFHARAAAPWGTFAPLLERAAEGYPEWAFGEVDAEEAPKLAAALEVTSVPTLLLLRDGVVASRHAGPLTAAALDELLRAAAARTAIRFAARTDIGMQRDHNEDTFSLIPDEQLFIVADGMGGHASGEVASKLATETVGELFERTRDEDATWPYRMDRSLSTIENRLLCGIKLANQRIFETACRDLRLKGMGTTIVAALVQGDQIYLGHVGDSRCYRIRDGAITQLTRDHSLLEDYIRANPEMTDEERRTFPHRNVITRALGMRDTVQVDIQAHPILAGDTYVMCSDGLSGMLADEQILGIVTAAATLEGVVAELVDSANRAGGTDNITTLVLRCGFEAVAPAIPS